MNCATFGEKNMGKETKKIKSKKFEPSYRKARKTPGILCFASVFALINAIFFLVSAILYFVKKDLDVHNDSVYALAIVNFCLVAIDLIFYIVLMIKANSLEKHTKVNKKIYRLVLSLTFFAVVILKIVCFVGTITTSDHYAKSKLMVIISSFIGIATIITNITFNFIFGKQIKVSLHE